MTTMIDSIPSLQTVEDCDIALKFANKESVSLQNDLNLLEVKNDESFANGPNIERDITSVQLKIAAFESSILTMPDGQAKTDFELEVQKLKIKLASLIKKEGNYGLQGLLRQQAEFVAMTGQLAALQTFIAAVNVRKAAL